MNRMSDAFEQISASNFAFFLADRFTIATNQAPQRLARIYAKGAATVSDAAVSHEKARSDRYSETIM
jgi:hypothetical protein